MQFVSDLHLDTRPKEIYSIASEIIYRAQRSEIPVKYLALLGDISPGNSSYIKIFSEYISYGPWEHIFYVPGNHEYQTEDPWYIINKNLRSLETDYFHVMIRNRYELPDLTVVGCTLWSKLNRKYKKILESSMSDLKYIHSSKNKTLTFEEYDNFHTEDYNFIKAQINSQLPHPIKRTEYKPMWILTHHMPSYKCINAYYQNRIETNSAYATHLDSLVSKVPRWIFGHTHVPTVLQIGNCFLGANPLGNPGEIPIGKIRYNPGLIWAV